MSEIKDQPLRVDDWVTRGDGSLGQVLNVVLTFYGWAVDVAWEDGHVVREHADSLDSL